MRQQSSTEHTGGNTPPLPTSRSLQSSRLHQLLAAALLCSLGLSPFAGGLAYAAATVCGNGVLEGYEACDDGGTLDGDGCDGACVIEDGWTCSGEPALCDTTCGDGYLVGDEACDDENLVDGDGCSASCEIEDGYNCEAGEATAPGNLFRSICGAPTCGDATLDIGESCDDGDTVGGDGCSASCVVESGWLCTKQSPSRCLDNSNLPGAPGGSCGDGIVDANGADNDDDSGQAGDEVCDDGNTVSGDGCSADCLATETGFVCEPISSRDPTVQQCSSSCGDGIKAADEACDDGDAGGDGCDASCRVEQGYHCPGNTCAPAACGDGYLDGGEACDDGNIVGGDGCAADCVSVEPGWLCTQGSPSACFYDTGGAGTCGDGILDSDGPDNDPTTTGDNEACDDGGTATGDGCDALCMVEVGYHCQAADPADPVTFTCTTVCGDGEVDGAETCDDGNTVAGDGCSDLCFVEPAYTCSGGPPETCSSLCGDGLKASDEACDDGNTVAGDGCSADCGTREPGYTCANPGSACVANCGDGVRTSGEACDDGNSNNGDGCTISCTIEAGYTCSTGSGTSNCEASACGDGYVAEPEACDDKNTVDGDGCSADCMTVESGYSCSASPSQCVRPVCGDGFKTGDEACDDLNTDDGDGCSSDCLLVETGFYCSIVGEPCISVCGDGRLATPEHCDDGNGFSGDGCSNSCLQETGYDCSSGSCISVCGDTFVALGNEECDDGDRQSGDGCSSSCRIEPGYACVGTGCSATCGDGMRAPSEPCDDGNPYNGDGCSSACQQESGFACAGTPSACATDCGDRLVAGQEQCDDGNLRGRDGCSATCTIEPGWNCNQGSCRASACGDGYLAGDETCDDGNTAAYDGCGPTCRVESDWACSNTSPSFCLEHVTCGDGEVSAPAEDCDDGNGVSGDGCDQRCQQEHGWTCSNEACIATACGDGARAGDEACDDGNSRAADGCDSSCQVESGWMCAGSPSDCTAVCGDSMIVGGETCDDGNTANGDGCSASCREEVAQEAVDAGTGLSCDNDMPPNADGECDLVVSEGAGGGGCSAASGPIGYGALLWWVAMLGLLRRHCSTAPTTRPSRREVR